MAGKDVTEIMREDGVKDLRDSVGLKCASLFAKAIYTERMAGATTPEALEYLEQAIEEESKTSN